MNPAQLLSCFDRISDAPDAIPRLRRFVLDLAVRGKLVEQDPRDEPVTELLRRIQTEKSRRVKSGEIRAPRESEASDEEDVPFQLPANWIWCRLSEVGAIIGGGTPPSGDLDNFTDGGSGVAWLTPADLGKHSALYVSHGARDLTPQGLRSSSATLMPKGSVLFTSRAPIGYTAIASNEISTNQGFKSVVPYILDCNLYIAVYFRAFAKWIDGKASGTTFREVSGKIVGNLPFPLPPLAEQQRIVAKVDELMALCDRLEATQAERESKRDRLAASSLNRLNNGAAPDEFRDHARFCLNHLPRFTTRPEHIQQLRQTILNLAVRGKLVPQDPNDEPGEAVLQRIHSGASANMAGNGSTVGEELGGLPFDIPNGWSVSRLGSILLSTRSISYGVIKLGTEPQQGGVFILRCSNVRFRRIDLNGIRKVTEQLSSEYGRTILEGGEVLINVRGTLGGCAVVPPELKGYNIAREVAVIPVHTEIDPTFLLNVIASPYFQDRVDENLRGIAYEGLNLGLLRDFLVPIPAAAEQRRIVAKVDELLALCERLEAQITTTQTESRRLLEAVLHEALAPALNEAV